MKHYKRSGCLLLLLLVVPVFALAQESRHIIDAHDFFHGFEAMDADSYVNVVVEIPAGSNEKWEVSKETGHLEWETRQDTFRVVPYLPYPANYGMIPRTFLPLEEGGDNDPLDAFLLGPAHNRGDVIKGRLVGVIKTLDKGEQDDKLIAVDPESWFHAVHSLQDLQAHFPGVLEILVTWLQNYKGEGVMELQYTGDETETMELLEKSMRTYEHIYGGKN